MVTNKVNIIRRGIWAEGRRLELDRGIGPKPTTPFRFRHQRVLVKAAYEEVLRHYSQSKLHGCCRSR